MVDILQGGVRLLTPLYKYVRRESNDPPIITKNIPARINKRLSSRPFHRTKHRSTKPLLHTKKYSTRTDATTLSQTKKRTTKRHSLMYNPPFSKNVKPNIAHRFLTLDNKHFPKDHKLRKILNRNTVKISYSCMNNS